MDSERFDRLVRSFGRARSRRQTLRGLAGAVAATGALAFGGREASADPCKGDGKKCTKDGQCCSSNCVNPSGRSVAKSGGTCQPKTPHVCAGKDAPSPCFPNVAPACGTSGTGRTCRCGTDIEGNPTCYDNTYCLGPDEQCASNADCEALNFGAGSACFFAGDPNVGCCRGNACTAPCPYPSA